MTDVSKTELRNLRIDDYHELKESMIEAYRNREGAYWKELHNFGSVRNLKDRRTNLYHLKLLNGS